uniref:Ig-like domain-containing protein n=1 Tax=Sus scrofa TaxID=9823 RepID=A0A8W4F893_PIG
ALPRSFTSAEPSSVIPGWLVTIVCQSPAGAEKIREKEDRSICNKKEDVSQIGPHQTETRFPIAAVSEDTAQHYQCSYHQSHRWSEPSETLELVLTGPAWDFSSPHTQPSSSAGDTWTHSQDGNNPAAPPGPWTEHVYILIGVSAAFLLCLLLLVLLLLQRWHQRKRGPPRSKGKEPEPQERLSPAVDVLDGTPDPATVHRLPEKDRETEASTPADLQEVTYALLDHRTLTQRAARAVTPLSAESSTYAAISRH